MTTILQTQDGRELARDLTTKEINDLARAGVSIDAQDGDNQNGGDGPASKADDVVDQITTSQGDSNQGRDTGFDADALQDALDAMKESSDDLTAGDFWDIDDDYHTPDAVDESRAEDLAARINERKTDLGQEQDKRDRRGFKGRYTGAEIRTMVNEDGLVDDLKDALRELKTRDRTMPAEFGDQLNIDAVVAKKAGAFGERNLFLHTEQAESGDRAMCVALDSSGSMYEDVALKLLGALAEATQVIGDEFCAVGYASGRGHYGNGNKTQYITGPQEAFDYDHLDGVRMDGGTPTADGIMGALELVGHANKPEKIIVVVTDGEANDCLDDSPTGDYDGDVRHAIHVARSSGVKVIGLGCNGASPSYMREQFGEDFVTADMSNLVEALVEIYKRQMKTLGQGGGW